MNIHKQRHKLLKIISIPYIKKKNLLVGKNSLEQVLVQKNNKEKSYLEIEKILIALKCNRTHLELICFELMNSQEISFICEIYKGSSGEELGIQITDKGLQSLINKKYNKISWNEQVKILKDIVQIAVPALLLIVAIITLTSKLDNFNKSNKKRFEKIERKIDLLESKINIETSFKNDSLNINKDSI